MLYGFVYHTTQGIELHISGYPYMQYIGYTEKQARQLYRKQYGLKYKKITWL